MFSTTFKTVISIAAIIVFESLGRTDMASRIIEVFIGKTTILKAIRLVTVAATIKFNPRTKTEIVAGEIINIIILILL